MPHADSAYIPSGLSKGQFWEHVYGSLAALLDGQRSWVTNLANASSLIYNSLLAYEPYFGAGERQVNWCGFYIESSLFPGPRITSTAEPEANKNTSRLLLGPFCGMPACQLINTTPGKARGVCADAFLKRETLLVPEVDAYPGHIACDSASKSEIVCPLIVRTSDGKDVPVGVLDLDCVALSGFDETDKVGLKKITALVVQACDW
ncbi:GAF domain-like protein [Abortiporus biennis]|nr:GAF domain-like protein [Abortiporus biennis]